MPVYSSVRRIARTLGLRISRLQVSPFEYLMNAPRYEQNTVDLLGFRFRIADSLSFYWSHREIFLEEIYKFQSPTESPLILDCGSNCGTSIVYFKSLYPDARIIGVEADPEIFELLEWNLGGRKFKNLTLVNKAVTAGSEPVRFHCEGADGGRLYPLAECKAVVTVLPITLDDLISEPVDFLKMDIEGAETEAICSSRRLGMVNQLFVEYHSFEGVNQNLSALLEKLSSVGFRYYIRTKFCSHKPLFEERTQLGMDLQLNIFAKKK